MLIEIPIKFVFDSGRLLQPLYIIEILVKFLFGSGRILKSSYVIEIPILLAGEQITIKFDVTYSDIPLLLQKNTMKQWNLTINTRNDTAELIVNDKLKEVKLYTCASG